MVSNPDSFLFFHDIEFADMLLGAIQIITVNSAPSPAALGATNGLAQTVSSGLRAAGPSAASSLFSASLQHKLPSENSVFIILLILAAAGFERALRLPAQSLKGRL
jgi:hypothetical protein